MKADLNDIKNHISHQDLGSLRGALTELTSGNVDRIIGKADENRFVKRLEQGQGIILVVQLDSLLTKRAASAVNLIHLNYVTLTTKNPSNSSSVMFVSL